MVLVAAVKPDLRTGYNWDMDKAARIADLRSRLNAASLAVEQAADTAADDEYRRLLAAEAAAVQALDSEFAAQRFGL